MTNNLFPSQIRSGRTTPGIPLLNLRPSRLSILAWVSINLLLLGTATVPGETKLEREYRKEQGKFDRQKDPIKRVKILIKMSRIDIREVTERVKKGNLAEADQFLMRYSEVVKKAGELLRNSDRDAQKKPSGFKDLEISLRKQLRKLEDLKNSYPFDQQEQIGKTIAYAESIKGEMIAALFGAENVKGKK